MLVETIPMWTERGTPVLLREILTRFQSNDWRWHLEEFDGIGRFPDGLTWTEFQAEVENGAAVFDWDGIQQFADGLDQMIDGRIVATDVNGAIALTIEARDSTEYEIAIASVPGHPAGTSH
ncbi:hypothetical protein [Nocardia coubleae]|uniref:Uncharacterized protein n=1 Tax=Nocardia coubleae TaxID=356147 RepID=A0A846VZB7_9NOCA|nr:hypothetical protein [Nocardia coubleae]NKX85787.1 hypothetical protein [Nocardia coubleae]